jgi:hypothetical protein
VERETVSVVLLSAEDAVADTIRPRLEAAQADLARAIVVRYLPSSMGSHLPQFPQDLYVLDAIIDRSAARLVVVDPLVAYLGKGVSAYRDHDVRRALAPLAQLAERTGASVVAVRHLSKLRARNPLYRGGGSIGIIGAARSGLLVARDPADPDRRVLAVYKSNLGPPPPALAYRLVQAPNGAAAVQWEGPTTHTAADLLDEPTADDPDRESLEEAKLVLQTILANGPVPAIEVRRQASQAALGPYALRRAKLALGVVSRKLGHPHQPDQSWVWVLPNP